MKGPASQEFTLENGVNIFEEERFDLSFLGDVFG
jgi:hypothetical protein